MTPRVIVPYTGAPDGRVWDALDATGWSYDRCFVGGSDRAYYDLLSDVWTAGETFCVIEHDIVVHPNTLDVLADCERDWCGCRYQYGPALTSGLGCVKFSAALIARHPDAMERVGEMSDALHPPKHWCRLDLWLNLGVLFDGGEGLRHEHEPPVLHLNSACSHGCM